MQYRHHARWTTFVFFLVITVALVLGTPGRRSVLAADSCAPPTGSIIAPSCPTSATYGLSYSAWNAKWWEYVYSIPAATNPLLDEIGADCGVSQSGPVFFLVGVLNVSGTATRQCTIPAGKALFFPLLNSENDDLGYPFTPPLTGTPAGPDPTTPPSTGIPPSPLHLSVDQLQAAVASDLATITALGATIDGVPVSDPFGYKAGPATFGYNLPFNNIYSSSAFGYLNIPPRMVRPAVADGYYLLVAPLSPGGHTVEFSGTAGSFTLHITYHLTVLP
jgi:hypothetical protein